MRVQGFRRDHLAPLTIGARPRAPALRQRQTKPGPVGNGPLLLTPLELLDRLAALVPPPRIAPARGPPLWEAAVPALTGHAPTGDPLTQPEPAYEFDERRTAQRFEVRKIMFTHRQRVDEDIAAGSYPRHAAKFEIAALIEAGPAEEIRTVQEVS